MFTENSLRILPILKSDSYDDVLVEKLWYNDSSVSEADGIRDDT